MIKTNFKILQPTSDQKQGLFSVTGLDKEVPSSRLLFNHYYTIAT